MTESKFVKYISIVFIILGVVELFQSIGISFLHSDNFMISAFLLIGILTVHFSLNKGKRGLLLISTFIFLSGIVIFVYKNFNILQSENLLFPSAIFIMSAGMLMLFIENSSEKIFLYGFILFIFFFILILTVLKRSPIVRFANNLIYVVIDYYPIFLIFFGINNLIKRKD